MVRKVTLTLTGLQGSFQHHDQTFAIEWDCLARPHSVATSTVMVTISSIVYCVSLVDRIRRTFARIHQSAELGKLPDRRGIVSDTACSQARLCWAVQCIEMHLGAYIYSHAEYIVYVTYMHALQEKLMISLGNKGTQCSRLLHA